MKRLLMTVFVLATVAVAVFFLLNGKPKQPAIRLHIIGDSTMADYVENTTRTRGWGEMLQEFFAPEVEVVNYARGGRSSHSRSRSRAR